MRPALAAIASFLVFSSPATAQTELGACNGRDMDASISACGKLIENTTLPAGFRGTAYRNRAIRLLALGRLDDALSDLSNDLKLEPRDAVGLTIRATVYLKLGKVGNASLDLNKALVLNPSLPQAFVAKGLLEYQSGDLDAAIYDSSKAIDLDSRQSAAYNNRGAALRDKGEYERAIEDFNVVVRMNPEAARPLFNRGLTYQRMGNRAQALLDFEAALALSPTDPDALAGRDSIRTASGQTPKAAISVGAENHIAQTRAARQELSKLDYKQVSAIDLARLDQIATQFPELAFQVERIKSDHSIYINNQNRPKTSGEIQFLDAKQRLKTLLEKGKTDVFTPSESQQIVNAWFVYKSELKVPHFSNEPATEVQRDSQLEGDYERVSQIQRKFAVAAKERADKEAEDDKKFFASNIPPVCKSFPKTEAFEAEEKSNGTFIKMAGLFQAGDNDDACVLHDKIAQDVEDARSEMITCYRAAEALSGKSQKMGQLGDLIMVHASQLNSLKIRLEQIKSKYHCR